MPRYGYNLAGEPRTRDELAAEVDPEDIGVNDDEEYEHRAEQMLQPFYTGLGGR